MSAAAYVYRLFDAEGRLLYVGSSKNPLARFEQHKFESTWWASRVTRAKWRVYPSRDLAFEAEKVAIRSEHPLHNVQTYGESRDSWTAEYYVDRVKALLESPFQVSRRRTLVPILRVEYGLKFGRDLGRDVGWVVTGYARINPAKSGVRRSIGSAA